MRKSKTGLRMPYGAAVKEDYGTRANGSKRGLRAQGQMAVKEDNGIRANGSKRGLRAQGQMASWGPLQEGATLTPGSRTKIIHRHMPARGAPLSSHLCSVSRHKGLQSAALLLPCTYQKSMVFGSSRLFVIGLMILQLLPASHPPTIWHSAAGRLARASCAVATEAGQGRKASTVIGTKSHRCWAQHLGQLRSHCKGVPNPQSTGASNLPLVCLQVAGAS